MEFPSILRGTHSNSGAYLLEALEEQGWTLAPKPRQPFHSEPSVGVPKSVFVGLRDNDTISGVQRDPWTTSNPGWQVREYVDAERLESVVGDLEDQLRGERDESSTTIARLRAALGTISEHAHLDEQERGFGEASRYYLIADEALEGGEQHGG